MGLATILLEERGTTLAHDPRHACALAEGELKGHPSHGLPRLMRIERGRGGMALELLIAIDVGEQPALLTPLSSYLDRIRSSQLSRSRTSDDRLRRRGIVPPRAGARRWDRDRFAVLGRVERSSYSNKSLVKGHGQ
jgi:hypothetical protein